MFKKRVCKMCDIDIAPKGTGYMSYDEEGLCTMCAEHCINKGLLGRYSKMDEVMVAVGEKEFNMYMREYC